MKIEQLMSRGVQSCSEGDPLVKAVQLMWERDIGCVPVLDKAGAVAGVITDRDCVMAAFMQGRRLDEIEVGTVMSRKVVTCQPTDSLEVAATAMKKALVRRLPVVNKKGALVGMVALTDLSRAAEREPNQRVREELMREVELALAEVGRPRASPVRA
ncbi:MAG: CBS domain-containing protein [Myxococcaceae bacterium]|nr:CBS domain-containing protein [Myxococcaceae bacterium]